MDRPIPPFYCVYMLRSTVTKLKHLYIGSTPNPRRRLRQHNGEIQGGAVRTADARRRPWEMAVIISGFPSKIAALQFEWSLQNTHLTRHVRGADKDTLTTGRRRPPATLNKKLQDLHILLRANSFAKWPLQVKFFAEDAYRHWQSKTSTQFPYPIPAYTKVVFDGNTETNTSEPATESIKNGQTAGVNAVDVSYGPLLGHLRKSSQLVSQGNSLDCTVCRTSMRPDRDLFAVCPNNSCNMTAHLTCLTGRLPGDEGPTGLLLPVQVKCPTCDASLDWGTIAKETSLRARGKTIIEALLKAPTTSRNRGAETTANALVAGALDDDDNDGGSESEQEQDLAISGLVSDAQAVPPPPPSPPLHPPPPPSTTRRKPKSKASNTTPSVVPDSDTDDIDDISV